MRKFYDLNLRLPLDDFNQAERMTRVASALGYSGVGVSLPEKLSVETMSKLRQLCSSIGVDFVTRVDFTPKSTNELLSQLRRFRRRFELICVSCQSKHVARQAAKDRRVDLISFPSSDFRKRFFDDAEAELATGSFASLEISMLPLLLASSYERTRLLSSLRREVATAEKFSVPIIVSSGAMNEFSIRAPRELPAFCQIFDMSTSTVVAAISENPANIVRRNRMKLSPKHVAPGISIVRRGKDCEE